MRIITRTLQGLLLLTVSIGVLAANLEDPMLERGEEVYQLTCATSYCHGPAGGAAGAPRLAAREFDALYIASVTANGVPDTPMVGFANALSAEDMTAVLTYVAFLNGIINPQFSVDDPLASLGIAVANPRRIPLAGAAQEGRELFFDAYDKGLKRCSTCHEVEGIGIPVASPIATVPASVSALRNIETPNISTVTLSISEDDSMPALLLSRGIAGVKFYDMSVVPPVLRTIPPGSDAQVFNIQGNADWQHRDYISAYTDAELERVLTFLRAISE